MNILERNGINLNWLNCYIGFKNNWLKKEDLMNFVTSNANNPNLDELTIELLTSENESDNTIISILEKIISIVYGKDILKDNKSLEKNVRLWQLGFLLDIENMDIPIKDKLIKVSELWAGFNYPNKWRNFIYYMPAEKFDNDIIYNDEYVYNNFLNFIEMEKKELIS